VKPYHQLTERGQARLCAIFSWVRGTNLAENMSLANIFRLGELAAKLHAHART